METMTAKLEEWGTEMALARLPRWSELPDLELYMDQVINLVDVYLTPFIKPEKHNLLTKSMVNNYVKLGMIPAPKKKRYTKTHVAFLIAITTLKQVLTINEIKEGILFQGKVDGIQQAYDLFCQETESAVGRIASLAQGKTLAETDVVIPVRYLAVRSATLSFANKLLAEKAIQLEIDYLQEA
ncbi:fatty acid-binding protein DegV [Enterococcus sp. CU9D]|nr:DUF1836 domain-containing protein [Enterococcus sp. CU9D]KAF1292562.1 fatty acid-binding protein DegV [Enterococcus sp. CU9D]